MADQKVTELVEETSPATSDLLYLVDDPAGSPISKKVKVENIGKPGLGLVVTDTLELAVLLHDETLAGSGQFDVSGIDQGYDHLVLKAMLRSDVAAIGDSVYLFFNNDTDVANYCTQAHFAENAAVNALKEVNKAWCCTCPGATSPANSFGYAEIVIPFYTNTSYLKMAKGEFFYYRDTDIMGTGERAMTWVGSTSAITRITLHPDGYAADEFVASSRLQIIGIKSA